MARDSFLKGLAVWDSFSRTVDEYRERTVSGGVISMISVALISTLIVSELVSYLTVERHTEFMVDRTREDQLRIFIDIDFPAMSCELLGVDVLEQTGNAQLSVTNHLYKTKLNPSAVDVSKDGKRKKGSEKRIKAFHLSSATMELPKDYCGSCFGALDEDQCCNTCDAVRKAYERRGWLLDSADSVEQCVREGVVSFERSTEELMNNPDGCNMRGFVEVAKVAGNFHIAPGQTFEVNGVMLHDMSKLRNVHINMTHHIHHLTIGDSYPGKKNPLDGVSKMRKIDGVTGVHEYFLKVVPTSYTRIGWFGRHSLQQQTYQYSVQEYFHEVIPSERGKVLPGVFFIYDLSPIAVVYEDRRSSILHFIVQLCAIVGGIFTVAGMLDQGIYQGAKAVRKIRLGKSD
mmetsp:Transcript_13620/g.29495  ORF Transcript_13620/g.29495 Transcript_13620/m.29495 type:complete len:401 (+) Transcript_13620:147-1349(+)